jgi:APA family basic amino acid/polyamine antiporter
VSAGVAIAAFGALNGWILIQGQVPYAVAKDKLFPAIFASQNKKGVPMGGIIIGSILVSVVMSMNYTKGLVEQFRFLILLSTLTVLVPYLFSSLAYLTIRIQKKYFTGNWFQAVALATIGFLYSLWAIAGAGQETVYWGFLLLMAGLPFYVWIVWKNSKEKLP